MRYGLPQLAMILLSLLVGCSTHAQAKPAEPEKPEKPAKVSPEALELLNKIEAASAKLKTLKARIRYSRTQSLTGDEQVRFGDFYYQAKQGNESTQFAVLFDRLLVNENKNARKMQTWYIFDGNWLLERDHEDKQATRREMVPKGAERDSELSLGDGRLPIPLRLKAQQVLKSYHVTLPKREDADPKLYHLRLTPRKAGDDDQPLDLWFNKESLLLYSVETEVDGDVVKLNLPTPKPNHAIKAEVFNTALPDPKDGWQVQEVPL